MWSKFDNVTPVLKISQYSQKNTCVGVYLHGFRSALKNRRQPLMFPCEYYKIFINTYFEENLQKIASYFMKKNREQLKTRQLMQKMLNQWESMGFKFRKLTFLCGGYIGKFTQNFL